MQKKLLSATIAVFALLTPVVSFAEQEEQGEDASQPRIVIPFDFESKFDEGRYGQIVGEMVWKKLEREGGFVIPESMLDVREWCERTKTLPNPDTPLDAMKKILRDDFGADIAVWGKVERVPGFDLDVYDLWINVADFSGDKPRIIYQTKSRTKTVSEISHLYVKAALDALYGRQSGAIAGPDPEAEQRWASGTNLVQGDFEKGRAAPAGWDPLPNHVKRVVVSTDNDKENHVVRFQFPGEVAATTGVLYYSDFFPVEEGAMYRFQCRWRTTGSAAKVFIKCYDELPTRFEEGQDNQQGAQRREVYRSQQNLKGPAKTWNVHTEDFTPKHTQYTPRWGRVMLYAYWPAGAVDWDDVVVKQIKPPPANQKPKDRRPSLETKVRTEELERATDVK